MIVWKRLGFDSSKAGVKAGNRTAFLLRLLSHLAPNTLKGVSDGGAG
jgi:hypothetical protein